MPKFNKNKAVLLFLLTSMILSLLFFNIDLPMSASGSEPIYLHGPSLTPIHMHSNESLEPIHMNSNITLTPIHMHYVGPEWIDPIYEPLLTDWHELYPGYCQNWTLTSFIDYNGDGMLSPNDQIDMTNEQGNVTWYHVDRITWTLNLTSVDDPEERMFIEFKGPPEVHDPIGAPVCTYWHEVYPNYCNVYHIVGASGPLEYCTYIDLYNMSNGITTMWHVEDVDTDLILREKIMDPICTWWHEIYPDYCKWWHITSWEDNQLEGDLGYGQLSPCDQIDMVDPYFEKWETFWSMGDVNRDGLIDVLDIELIADAFGSSPGDPGWNPDADLNQDGTVNMGDMGICGANQGLDIWTYFGVPGSRSMKEWYHVDRVTITLNVTLEKDPTRWMKIELKTYYFEEMYNALKHPIDTLWHEIYPNYCNDYVLTWWDWFEDDNCNGVLDVCDYIWLYNMSSEIEDRYHVEDICYDLILNKKIANPICTNWHEIYPEFCQNWHLTSWEDNGDGLLSPCDQIDMEDARWETFGSMGDTDRDGYIDDDDVDYIGMWFAWHGPRGVHRADLDKDGDVDAGDVNICAFNYGKDIWTYYPDLLEKTWYHVDRVTLTLYVTNNMTGELYYFEYKGPFEGMYKIKTDPICSTWHMVWPYYEIYPEEPYHIEDWIDNCNGVLDYCDYVMIWGSWFHVEDLAIDIILNEKISDPVCTWWHELYPEYCNEYHIIGWEDNDDGLLSPCDLVDLDPIGWYHVKYVTVTINITDPAYPDSWIVLEYYYEGPVEAMYWVKTHPNGTWWYEPGWIEPVHQIQDWMDNCNGVLDYCDYVMFYDYWYHVEEVAIDIVVEPPPKHDVGVDRVASLYPWVYQGQIDPIDVTVTNYGDYDEPTVDVYAFYDGTLAAPKQTTSLNIGETKTLTFYWNTTGVPPGFYTVSANATIPVDDVPANNYLVGNVQEVRELPPPPEDLELHPREVVILGDPTSTQWHELHPSKSNYYHLTSWEPGNVLSPHDQIDMYSIDPPVKIWVETGFVNPMFPYESEWHEIEPTFCQWWLLTSWEDNNGDGYLSECDQIDMTHMVTGEVVWFHVQYIEPPGPEPGPRMMHLDVKYWFQVDEVTVDMTLTPVEGGPQIFVDYKCGYWTFDPANPICTKWNEIDPELGPIRCLHLTSWEDTNFDGKLSPSDIIDMTITYPYPGAGSVIWYHVDYMSITLMLTPKPSPPIVPPPPVGPIYLESETSYDEFDLANPVCTTWHEIYPVYSTIWHLSSWEDTPTLSPSDHIVLTLKDAFGEPIPGTEAEYHVDKLTVAMNLTSMIDDMEHIVKFEGSLKQFVNYHWTAPISTQWHEVNPEYCRQWHVIAWEDTNLDGMLDYCDMICMIDKHTGWEEWFHVESLSTDIIVSPPGVHDVAVIDVTPLKTIVGQGLCADTMYVNATVENQGDYIETFTVTAYANATIIETLIVSNLPPSSQTVLTFVWNTTDFAKGNYTISATAVLPGDDDPGDNTYTDGTVQVVLPGDINADGKVDMKDIGLLCIHYGAEAGDPLYVANYDVNCDGKINMKDIGVCCIHYGEEDP